jgi:hypothetical protein
MALPWSTLVKAIPWSDVIAKAPDIAQGARKLWQKVGTQESVGSAAAQRQRQRAMLPMRASLR